MPVVALGTNVLAVPIASGVMMVAPVLLAIAAFVPDAVAGLLAIPVVAAVRWVWWVAEWGTRLSVRGPVNALAWGLVVVGVLIRKKMRHHLHELTLVRGCRGADISHHWRRRPADFGSAQRFGRRTRRRG
jgi:hypothetical protein